MAQPEKKRGRHIYTLTSTGRRGVWEEWRVEERFAAMLESDAMREMKAGLPQMLICAAAAQAKLVGGASPFAPALVAATMMCGANAGWSAAGGVIGALIAWEPQVLLTCALLYILQTCLRSAGLRANELTCILTLGICMGVLPQITAQDLYERMMAGLGAAAAMMLAKLYKPALGMRVGERELLRTEEWIGLALLTASLLAGLQDIRIGGARPVCAAAILLSISAGYVGGAGAGAAAGGLIGLVLSVTQPAAEAVLGAMVLMGWLSGLFGRMGKGWTAAAAPMAAMLTAAAQPEFLSWGHAAELAAALTMFLCIRDRVWRLLRGYMDREVSVRAGAEMTQEMIRRALCGRLEEYAALYARMARRTGSAGGQFAAVSGALKSMAEEMGVTLETKPQLAAEIARALDAAGIRAQDVQAVDEGGKLCVRLRHRCAGRDGLCDGRILQAVSRAAGMTMRVRPTGYCPKEGLCALEMEAANRYEVNAGWASGAQEDGQPCGDTMTAVQLPQGRYLLALADGMGHGRAAQEESRAAVELMEDFLLARFEPEAALHGVNEMMLSGGGERFSTMDLMLVDLENGNLRAMKIGAVPSYIRRGKHIIRVGGDALPMGIVERVKPSVTQLQLEDGDVMMMVSDGVTDAVGGEEGWLQAELLKADARAPEAAAKKIMEEARKVGRHRDDMTVCLARVVKRGN